jgi:GT2 family glycosyltransferase
MYAFSPDMLPRIGIIYLTFPTKNWERDIERALLSFEKLNYPKDRLELICVESKGSRPPVKDWFEKTWMPKSGTTLPRIHYVFTDQEVGFSGNNNLGLAKARELGCDYVHLTNEDTDVDPDYLLRAVECAESDREIGAVQSLILLGEERDKINSSGNEFHFLGFGFSKGYKQSVYTVGARRAVPLHAEEIGYASGAAVLVRISALHGEQLFDEKFFSYHEDTDLSLRLKLRGYKIVIEPKSVMWHYYEFAKNKINYYWMERNRYALIFSYYKCWTLFLIFPMLLVMEIAQSLFSIKGGWWDMKRKAQAELFSRNFWKWICERRRQLKKIRTISDRQLLKHAVAAIEFQDPSVRNPVLEFIGNPVMKAYWWVVKRFLV